MTRITLLCLLFFIYGSAFAGEINSRFPGFENGDKGYGFVLGEPISFRYQNWTDWKHAVAYGVGYEQNGSMLTASWSYYFYQLSEDDRWKGDAYVGTIMYGFQLGVTGGIHLGSENEASRIGIEGGLNFEYLVPNTALSIRFEVLPVLYISGRESAGIHGGVGLTYYFDSKGNPQSFNRGYVKSAKAKGDSELEDEFDESSFNKKRRKKRKKKVEKKKKKKKKRTRRKVKRKKKIKKTDTNELDI